MQGIIEKLSDVGKIEMEPRFAGRRITMIIGPDRPKIERLKQQAISRAAHEAQLAAAQTEQSPPETDAATEPPPPGTDAAPPKPAKVSQG